MTLNPIKQLVFHLNANGVELLFDVGAHSGGFAGQVRGAGYGGKIISVEPMIGTHAALSMKTTDENWIAARRCALGEVAGKAEINIAGNSYSSSLLEMDPLHIRAAPQSAYVEKQGVEVVTLDQLDAELGMNASVIGLKIDTQGYEGRVLAGGAKTLERTRVIFMELSLDRLYEGQDGFYDLIARMAELQFDCVGLHPFFYLPKEQRQLQLDGLFVRRAP